MAPTHSRRTVLKKLATAVATAGIASPILSACSSAAVPETLALSTDLGGASLSAVLRGSFIESLNDLTASLAVEWEQERNASIDVVLSEEWRVLVPQMAEESSGADVGELFGNQPHLLRESLVDVSDLAETIGESLGGWTDVARLTCQVDGVWRSVPWSTLRSGLVTRTDLLAQVGADLPDTYDDLLEAATLLQEDGAPPLGITMSVNGPSDSASIAYAMLWSFGAQEVSDDGSVALDSSETRAALNYWQELSQVNLAASLNWGHPGNNAAYLSNEISMTQNASSILIAALEQELAVADDTLFLPFPEGPSGRFQLPEINSLGVFTHSLEVAAARDWIQFVSQPSTLVDRTRESLAFFSPLVQGLNDDPELPWNTDPRLAGLSTDAAVGRMPGWPLPPSVEAGLVYDNASIVDMFNAVGSGTSSVDEAVRNTAENLRRVYET